MQTVRELREAAATSMDEAVAITIAAGELVCDYRGNFFLNRVAVENADFIQDLLDGLILEAA